jgi:hypothetical protein
MDRPTPTPREAAMTKRLPDRFFTSRAAAMAVGYQPPDQARDEPVIELLTGRLLGVSRWRRGDVETVPVFVRDDSGHWYATPMFPPSA